MDKANRKPTQTERIVAALSAQIRKGDYPKGQRVPSENELCREFGVSRTTARQAVLRLVKDGFLVRYAGSGTFVRSDNPTTEGTRASLGTIGFVRCRHSLAPHRMEGDYVYVDVLRGIQEEIDLRDQHVLSIYLPESDKDREKKLEGIAGKVDGLIVAEVRTQEFYEVLEKAGLPIVLVNPNIYDYSCDAIDTDNSGGVIKGMKYLRDLGHSTIGFIRGRMPMRHAFERLHAYRQALEAAGLTYDDSLVAGGSNWQMETGALAMNELLASHPEITAVFASSDPLALGVMNAARKSSRRVPEDLSVIGFDDMIIARHAVPPLTTIRIPRVEMGRCAAMTLFDLLTNPTHARKKVLFTPELIIRSSCAPRG